MSLDVAIAALMKQVPDCVACGVVDISTGMLLGVKTTDSHPQEVLDLVAAATGDLFQGSNVIAIENMRVFNSITIFCVTYEKILFDFFKCIVGDCLKLIKPYCFNSLSEI